MATSYVLALSSDRKTNYRVRLAGDEQGLPVIRCECEGWFHRHACRHQEALVDTLLREPCPACGGKLEANGTTLSGLRIVACTSCEFAVDYK